MKFNIKKLEGEWVRFNDEVELLIRPFPNSKQPFRVSGELTIGEYNWTVFKECMLDWKGITDQDGNPLKCDAINKQKIFDSDIDLFNFVHNEQSKIKVRQEEEVKN